MTEQVGDGYDYSGIHNRSANVTYSFGSDLKFLSSNETTKCVYEIEVQLLGLSLEADDTGGY